jgi:hypothetical protein
VLDPDGNNIEVVDHNRAWAALRLAGDVRGQLHLGSMTGAILSGCDAVQTTDDRREGR